MGHIYDGGDANYKVKVKVSSQDIDQVTEIPPDFTLNYLGIPEEK